MRRLAAVLALTITLLLGVVVPSAVAGGPNNVVVADATGAGTAVARSGLLASSTGTNDLTSTNLAQAVSHDCTGCRAVAIAIQAVLVTGSPPIASPRNLAVAANVNCISCASFAFAFQYVVATGGPAHLSPAGVAGVDALRQEIADAAASGLPFADLQARLDGVAARFEALVDAEIVRTGPGSPVGGTVHERVDEAPSGA